MSRGLSAPNVTASTALHVRPLVFVKLEFDGVTYYYHNGVGNYVWGGFAWQGIGALGAIGPIEESLDLSPYAVSMGLTVFEPALLAEAVAEEIYNKPATVYIGLLDDNGQLVADPQERWGGGMDHTTIRLGGGDDHIELLCESEFKFLDRANGSLFTDEDQQRLYPGDLAFEFLDQMIDIKLAWGPGGSPTSLGRPSTGPRPGPGTPLPPGVYNNPYLGS